MKIHLSTHSDRVNSVAFRKESSWVAAALQNGYIEIWDYEHRSLIDSFLAHHDGNEKEGISTGLVNHGMPCNCVDFSENGLLCSGGDDKKIKFWKLSKNLLSFPGHKDSVRSVCFHEILPWIVSAGYDRQIFIWDYKVRSCLFNVSHSSAVTNVIFHGQCIVSTCVDCSLRVWDCEKLKSQKVKQNANGSIVNSEFVKRKCSRSTHNYQGVNSVAVSDSVVASVGEDCKVRLWELDGLKKVAVLSGHTNYVSDCCFQEKFVVSASEDGSLIVWDRESHEPVSEIFASTGTTRFWSLKPHNNMLAAGHDNGLLVFEYDGSTKAVLDEDWSCQAFTERHNTTTDPYAGEHQKRQARFRKTKLTYSASTRMAYFACCLFFGPIGVALLWIQDWIRYRREQQRQDANECELQTMNIV